jgi:histidinol-phosphate aminotransferase
MFDSNIAAAPLYVAGTAIEEIQRRYGLRDVVKLASNENPLGASPAALAAIERALPEVFRYPVVADDELRAALAALGGLAPENVATANGATELLDMIVRGFVRPGDEVIISRPTFPMVDISTRRVGGVPVWADLLNDPMGCPDAYDPEAVLAAVSERTRLIYICTPNNPTGSVVSRAQADELLRGLARTAAPQAIVVLDESYRDFADAPWDATDDVRAGRNVIAVRSFSKSWGLAGLRVGYAFARREIAEYLQRLRLPFHFGLAALRGALAALGDGEHVARSRALVLAERPWLQARLAELDLPIIPSQANFVAFRPPFAADLVFERLLRQGVIIRPLGFFYMPAWMRVTVGTHTENERFSAALRDVLEELRESGAEAQMATTEKVMV